MRDILPSLKFRNDDPRPVGFVQDLSDSHVEAAARVLSELAEAADVGGGTTELTVCFCSARYVPGFPFDLFSFHIADFDESGNPIDEKEAGSEIVYAVVLNQPLELQREIALVFLYDLVFRTVALARPEVNANEADVVTASASAEGHKEFRDRMRNGWREAVRSLLSRAEQEGIRLKVRYRRDPFPDRDALVRRMPALRATYNDIEIAREFVDKVVSLVAGQDPRVVAPGAPDEVRSFVQRKLGELGIRQYSTQTMRDAEVLGNGYLVMPQGATDSPYNLRPEDVEILGPERFAIRRPGQTEEVTAPVLHARGVEQFESPYGFSVLEAVVPIWTTRRTLESVESQTAELIARIGETGERRRYLDEVRELVFRHREETDERLSKLLWYPRDWVPDAVEGLYFPGQERM